MSRETCASHSHYTAFFNPVQDFFLGEVLQRIGFLKLNSFILFVIFHHDGIHHGSYIISDFFNLFHCS